MIGAGVAGLACALRAARSGLPVTLYEATANAGGRCRSIDDPSLGTLDNGTHLFLGANSNVFEYLADIGTGNRLTAIEPAAFAFTDLGTNATWEIRPNGGRLPWWVCSATRRVAGSRAHHYLAGWRLLRARPEATVAEAVGNSPLFQRLWRPLCEAILNTEASAGSARLLGKVLGATLLRGETACRPYYASSSLSETFVTPALATLAARGVEVCFGHRLRTMGFSDRAASLVFAGRTVALSAEDFVVLAVPWWMAARLLPWLPSLPGRSILNAHFRLPANVPPARQRLLGTVGGLGQWLLVRNGVLSVTVSAADSFADEDTESLALRSWREAASALSLPGPMPTAWRIIRERRATLAQTPAVLAARPAARTPLPNLLLAGDWTDTGWPCTVEGAIQSGCLAANLAASASLYEFGGVDPLCPGRNHC